MPQAGTSLPPFLGSGSQGRELGRGFLHVGRRGGDNRGLGAFELLCFEAGHGDGAAGRRVEPHEEQTRHRGGHAHHRQAHHGESAGRNDCPDGGADHEDQFSRDGVEGEGGTALFAGGQDTQRLPHHAEDRQGQQSPDEYERQQQLVGHMGHHRPDDGLRDDGRYERLPQAHCVHAGRAKVPRLRSRWS